MLATEEFARFAATVVPFLHVTTRIPGRADDDLLARLARPAWPTLLLLDADGRIVGRPLARTVAAFTTAVERARENAAERATPESALGAAAAAERYLEDRQLGRYRDPAEDRAAYLRHRPALTPEQRRAVETALAENEFRAAVEAIDLLALDADDLRSEAFEARLFRVLAARDALGAWPKGAQGNRALIALLAWADTRRDPALFERWLNELRAVRAGVLGGNAEFLAWFERRLEALRDGSVDDDFVTAFRARARAGQQRR